MENEREALKKAVEQKLKEKGILIVNTEKTDSEFLSALIDVCTLNQLRDATEEPK